MSTNHLIKKFRIKNLDKTPPLDFECFPFKVCFDVPGSNISITMDNQYFFYVNKAVMDQLHADIAADLKDIKHKKMDRELSNLMFSIFINHIRQLQGVDPAFDSYVVSNQIK